MKKINVKGVIIPNDDKWIYDLFGIDSVTPNDVLNELPETNEPLEVIINSPGGEVYSGSEIYTELKDYKGNVTTKIVGVAASAASVVAMAGDKTLMSPTAQLMIHNVSSMARGDYRDLQHESEVLKNYNTTIANAYVLKSGKTHEEFLKLMDEEKWFTAQQALEHKLIDEIMFQNEAQPLAASVHDGLIPQSVINKIRNMKDKFQEEKSNGDIEQRINNQKTEKEKLQIELDLI